MEPTQDKYSETALVAYGLSPDEAKILAKWVESGKPGVSSSKAAAFASMYALGLSCAEIADRFPQYPLALILYECVRGDWKGLRATAFARLASTVGNNAAHSSLDAINLLTQVLGATTHKWRADLMRYLANPENEKAPEFIPESMGQYSKLLELLKSLTAAPAKKDDPGAGGPLVSVTVGTGGEVRLIDPMAVKQALQAEAQKKQS